MAIKFRSSNSKEFSNYIDVGRAYHGDPDSFYDTLPDSYIRRGLGLEKWCEEFKNSCSGAQIDFINYFFLNDEFPSPEIKERLMKEKEIVQDILNSYIYEDSSLFIDFLEFNNLDDEDDWTIEKKIYENEDDEENDETPVEIYFQDGSEILTPDKEDIRWGNYIIEDDYEEFSTDVQYLVNLMFDEV